MRIVNLSDHVGDMLEDTKDRHRRAADAVDRAELAVDTATARLEAERRRKGWWRRLFSIGYPAEDEAIAALSQARSVLAAARRDREAMTQQFHQQSAGSSGENRFASYFETAVSDDWTLFTGYKNRKGEADAVMLGPNGLWVVEVKNRNAHVHIDGDEWTYVKYDNYRNQVDSGAAVDGGGRSWGRQASEVAGALQSFLEGRDQRVSIRTAVMLVHPKASVGSAYNVGVDLVETDPRKLVREMTSPAPTLSQERLSAIDALIRRDHGFHDERRRTGES